ncbi:uncharacterized protein LOC143072132 [Mytilus galloprovincialis]|uniref:uncharacterized protein LOC143072132 n=1 Tax=Mytilus galloprovincialis TaxID=29158 RepID=UPI003F7B68C7
MKTDTMSTMQWKKQWIVAIGIVVTVFLIYLFVSVGSSNNKFTTEWPQETEKEHNQQYRFWPSFKVDTQHNEKWLKSTCLKSEDDLSLDGIMETQKKWSQSQDSECRRVYTMFTSIFTITSHPARVVIPDTFAVKVRKWLGNKEELFQSVKKQTVMFIYNEYTREQNVYNPLREKRPMGVPPRPETEYVEELVQKTQPSCDFCKYKLNTAEDTFGRVESEHSFTAANTFKLDSWHTLILLKKHHPLNWTYVEYRDLMSTAQKWLDKAYQQNSRYKYPMFVWDLLPHAGASQVHPHVHGFLDADRYQGAVENWRVGADEYNEDFPTQNYFSDFVSVHMSLGLAVQYGDAVAIASILPKKDNEVIVLGQRPSEDFFKLQYFVYRAFIEDMKKLCFSSGFALPSLDEAAGEGKIPAYVRAITRGAVEEIRSDISSLELFTSQNANTDPYKVIKFIRESIKKRS